MYPPLAGAIGNISSMFDNRSAADPRDIHGRGDEEPSLDIRRTSANCLSGMAELARTGDCDEALVT